VQFIDVILGILNFVIVLLTLFLIGIILIQRGKGGGLAGAFGGVGGSSAFGTKTGDIFTKITVGVAIAWILLSMLMVVLTNRRNVSAFDDGTATSVAKQLDSSPSKSKDKDKSKPLEEVPAPSNVPTGIDGPPPIDIPVLPEVPPPATGNPTPNTAPK
jgi:preprotein translocase subunit SecG